jgi:four helix bundle protein
VRDFRNLVVWRKAHDFTLSVYVETKVFPPTERFGLTSQLRRAAVSIEANIAEGCGRESTRELLHHLAIASGSTSECECLVQIASDLALLDVQRALALMSQAQEVRRMLSAYSKYFQRP